MNFTPGRAQNWCVDPFGRHEARWFSQGNPTALVRDDGVESQDPPPENAFADRLWTSLPPAPNPPRRGHLPVARGRATGTGPASGVNEFVDGVDQLTQPPVVGLVEAQGQAREVQHVAVGPLGR